MSTFNSLLQQLSGNNTIKSNREMALQAIKDDLEGMLNSFVAPIESTDFYPQLNCSVINFGLQNYLTSQYVKQADRKKLSEQIKKQIEQFEPRLSSVEITMDDCEDICTDFTFYIQIKAKIHWQRTMQDVTLHSDWNPLNMSFKLI